MQVCTTYNGGQRIQAESEANLPAEMRPLSVRENTKMDLRVGRERSESVSGDEIVIRERKYKNGFVCRQRAKRICQRR